MNLILAVSGGVDSIVMLDLCLKKYPKESITVAHFNHKTRPSADDDQLFVEQCCKKYNIPFITNSAEKTAQPLSEETARNLRYDFLEKTRQSLNTNNDQETKILTAHHLDDLVESITINFLRGTGWRGLKVLSRENYLRPFIDGTFDKIYSRRDILRHAAENNLKYRFDPTNATDNYLRNRLREKTFNLDKNTKLNLLNLRNSQIKIENELKNILKNTSEINDRKIPRALFKNLDEPTASELLKFLTETNLSLTLTRPQLSNLYSAVLTYEPNKLFNLPKNHFLKITKHFIAFEK